MTIWNLMNNANFLLDMALFAVVGTAIICGIRIMNHIQKEKRIKKYLEEIEKRAKGK